MTSNILDTVSFQEQTAALRTFNPQGLVSEYLSKLPEREKQILESRYGLLDGNRLTLEKIGKQQNLTRERVRQIEKESLQKLGEHALSANWSTGVELLFQIIEEHGNIVREGRILELVLQANNTPVNQAGIIFILNLTPRFHFFKETETYHQSWYVAGFDRELFEQVINSALKVFNEVQKPLKSEEICLRIRQGAAGIAEISNLSNEVIESFLSIAKDLDKNPFGEWGHAVWPEIHPRDVGDKAYLVLLNLGRPEHYTKITELINKQGFDQKVAHEETVHNELIKDPRFVLVGRGIYGLASWGYRKGVVAEIIKEILQKAKGPLSREQIIDEVLKQRMVKRNTIIVGLSNHSLFRKTADNRYTNAGNA